MSKNTQNRSRRTLIIALLICAVLAFLSQQARKQTSAPADDKPQTGVTQEMQTPPLSGDGILTAHFIDVGQGDSALLALPNGQVILIDAGANVNAYLQNCGVTKIDYLIATHPHADHIACLADVIRSFDIGAVYMPKVSHTSGTYETLLRTIQRKELKIKTAKAGVTLLDTDGLQAEFVAPVGSDYESLNDYSAVLRIVYKNASMLFTGDAEALSEAQITADVRADVLKVGHHGSSSSTSSAFLKRVAPKYAVISCGADNSYGHPHKEVLRRLRKAGVQLYRTDENGTVVIATDGEKYSVQCERK